MAGWVDSATAWIAAQGDGDLGDFARQYVLDPVMKERIAGRGFSKAIDVGCGEGRFCRILDDIGIKTIGIDPTGPLLDEARRRDPQGDYRQAKAEALPFENDAFDLVISYLSLIDIPDAKAAIMEMARVLKPGGTLLIANLNSFTTAHLAEGGWVEDTNGNPIYWAMDDYLETRAVWERWKGIEIENWHRPLSFYFKALLGAGMQLTFFDEPAPTRNAPEDRSARYKRAPWAMVMEWQKTTIC